MPLNVKVVPRQQIEKLEAEIGYIKSSIEQVREVSRGGPDGVRIALKMFKDYREKLVILKNNCLTDPDDDKLKKAIAHAAEERALTFVIDIFENPKGQVQFYEDQLALMQKQLDEWRKLPQR